MKTTIIYLLSISQQRIIMTVLKSMQIILAVIFPTLRNKLFHWKKYNNVISRKSFVTAIIVAFLLESIIRDSFSFSDGNY